MLHSQVVSENRMKKNEVQFGKMWDDEE